MKPKIILNKVKNVEILSENNNTYQINVLYKPYNLLSKEKRKKSLLLNLGTIVFFQNFPFIDNKNEKKINFRNHYFAMITKDEKNFYLSYITTKTKKYLNNKYKNNNYILIKSDNKDTKNIIISSRRIYKINKKLFYKLLEEHKILINKKLLPEIKEILKQLLLNSEHLDNSLKENINFKEIIYKNKIDYSIENILENQDITELEIETLIKKNIVLYSNY